MPGYYDWGWNLKKQLRRKENRDNGLFEHWADLYKFVCDEDLRKTG